MIRGSRSVLALLFTAAFAAAGCDGQKITAPTSEGLGQIGQIGVAGGPSIGGRPLASESSDPAAVTVDLREDSGRLNLRFAADWDVRRVDIRCERFHYTNGWGLSFEDVKPPAQPNSFLVDDYSRLVPEGGIYRCTLTRDDNTPDVVVIRFSGNGPPGGGGGGGGSFALGSLVERFAMLGGAAVTCTTSVVTGDVGVSPGSSITGFPGLCTLNGTLRTTAESAPAKAQLAAAYADMSGRPCATISSNLNGQILTPGVYCVPAAVTNLTSALTFNGAGEYVLIFSSTFITSGGSSVSLQGGATCGGINYVVGSSATLAGALSGNVIASDSVTTTGATITGRALAITAAVTMTGSTITNAGCS